MWVVLYKEVTRQGDYQCRMAETLTRSNGFPTQEEAEHFVIQRYFNGDIYLANSFCVETSKRWVSPHNMPPIISFEVLIVNV